MAHPHWSYSGSGSKIDAMPFCSPAQNGSEEEHSEQGEKMELLDWNELSMHSPATMQEKTGHMEPSVWAVHT